MENKKLILILLIIFALPQLLWAHSYCESDSIKIKNNAAEDSVLSHVLHYANEMNNEFDSITRDTQGIIVGLFDRADISEITYILLTRDNLVKCVFNNNKLKTKNIYKIQNGYVPIVEEIFISLDKLFSDSFAKSNTIKGVYHSPQQGSPSLSYDTCYLYFKNNVKQLESIVCRDWCNECDISKLQSEYDNIDWRIQYILAFHE